MLYPNLAAEQARNGLTDEDVAKIINMSRTTYVSKKHRGTFKILEGKKLSMLFNCTMDYLFDVKESQQATYKNK